MKIINWEENDAVGTEAGKTAGGRLLDDSWTALEGSWTALYGSRRNGGTDGRLKISEAKPTIIGENWKSLKRD